MKQVYFTATLIYLNIHIPESPFFNCQIPVDWVCLCRQKKNPKQLCIIWKNKKTYTTKDDAVL